ncbi:MAG: hypothetical protein K0Q49_1849 [Haloplasmataceae bacterium]|nr:hypothetical protein [Haloplasmataceae bacterium]
MLRLIKKCIIIIVLIIITILLNKKTIVISELEINYLKNNLEYLDVDHPNFNLLSADLLNNHAFIASEIHGIKANYKIEYNLFTYLNKNADVHFLLLEISFSSGFLLNEYVQTGNEELLDIVFSFYKGTPFWSLEEYQFFKELYEYNKTLPTKITLIGIDIEHSIDSYQYLFNLNILELDLLNHLKVNKENRDLLYNDAEFNWQLREDKMYLNYLSLSKIYQVDQFYGQFGTMHCFKNIINDDFKSLAYLLSHDELSNVKDQTIVIITLYNKSHYLQEFNSNKLVHYSYKDITNYLSNSIDYFEKTEFMLFKLNQNNSPYQDNLIWLFDHYKIKNEKTVTTDYFDYIILINHSSAAKPLEKTNSYFEVLFDLLKTKLKI